MLRSLPGRPEDRRRRRRSLIADHNFAGGIDAVNLKYALRKIKTDGGNLHGARLLSVASYNDDHFRHSMPFSGGRPPHQLRQIANILASTEEHLSPEAELELSERLL